MVALLSPRDVDALVGRQCQRAPLARVTQRVIRWHGVALSSEQMLLRCHDAQHLQFGVLEGDFDLSIAAHVRDDAGSPLGTRRMANELADLETRGFR